MNASLNLKSGFIALIGRPNVGKSTLLNKVLGENLSIVSHKAQTTREHIRGIYTDPLKGQIIFTDTPGIHKAQEGGFNEFMVKSADFALEGCDGIWYLVDPLSKIEFEEIILERLKKVSCPVFVLLNKVDMIQTPELREKTQLLLTQIKTQLSDLSLTSLFELSLKKDFGVEALLEKTWDFLKVGPHFFPDSENLSDRPVKFFVSEMIRKKIYDFYADEVPYSSLVHIHQYIDKKNGHTRIEAQVIVERESQKGILIGQKGRSIKKLGEASRKDIEKFTGRKVYLELKVKVEKDWTKDKNLYSKYGYTL